MEAPGDCVANPRPDLRTRAYAYVLPESTCAFLHACPGKQHTPPAHVFSLAQSCLAAASLLLCSSPSPAFALVLVG